MSSPPRHTCHVCGKTFPASQTEAYKMVRPGISALIEKEKPGWGEGKYICKPDLNRFRRDYVEDLLEKEKGDIGTLEAEVLDHIASGEPISDPGDAAIEGDTSFGARMADKIAAFGGSWAFIGSFSLFLFLWMGVNVTAVLVKPFDPYPFILLNLVLSTLAAIQAPVIMMSQNRQEARDRIRDQNDYQVNLKAELEIRLLHEKIDHQMTRQWELLMEIQQVQIELMKDR